MSDVRTPSRQSSLLNTVITNTAIMLTAFRHHHPPRQSVSSHNVQPNQCGISLLNNDNLSLSYSFRSQDTETNRSPMRDKIPCKKETNLYRDDFDRAAENYDNSSGNLSKPNRGTHNSLSTPELIARESISRKQEEKYDDESCLVVPILSCDYDLCSK